MNGKQLPLLFAKVLSIILSPSVLVVIFIFALSFTYVTSFWRGLFGGIVGVFLLVGMPTLFVLWRYLSGRTRDLFLRRREDRFLPLLVALVSGLVGIVILQQKGAPTLLTLFGFMLLANLGVITLITFFWKISLHTATSAGLITLLVIMSSVNLIWLYVFVVLSGWARVKLKDHSLTQVVAGALVAIILTFVLMWLGGFKVKI